MSATTITGTYFDQHPTAKAIASGLAKGGLGGMIISILAAAVASLPGSPIQPVDAIPIGTATGAIIFADEAIF